MKELRLKVENIEDYNLLLRLAKRLGIDLKQVQEDEKQIKKSSSKMADILETLAANGGMDIEDPVQWQRDTRKDRNFLWGKGC